MVQLIKKGGLRERANRSQKYAQSENNIKTLNPHSYTTPNSVSCCENMSESQQVSSKQSNLVPENTLTNPIKENEL